MEDSFLPDDPDVSSTVGTEWLPEGSRHTWRTAMTITKYLTAGILLYSVSGCSHEEPVGPQNVNSASSRAGSMHTVTGSGVVELFPGFSFRNTVAAHIDASGKAHGSIVSSIVDGSAFGITGPATVRQEITCMVVVGNTAWLGTRVTHVTSPQMGTVGEPGVAWIVDLGGPRTDIMYGGPSSFWDPNGAICTGTPPMLPPAVANPGNFTVR
jgi:hypothetical protein